MDILCLALRVRPKQYLPTEDYEGLESVVKLEHAIVQRHRDVGKPLAALSQQRILQGYYTECDRHIILNLWSPKEAGDNPPEVDLTFADVVKIVNVFDAFTAITITQQGRTSVFEDIRYEFGEQETLPPAEKEVWDLTGLGFPKKAPQEAPAVKRRRLKAEGEHEAASGAEPAKATAPQAGLSQALRKRLGEKAPSPR